jgi:hypothetical protein
MQPSPFSLYFHCSFRAKIIRQLIVALTAHGMSHLSLVSGGSSVDKVSQTIGNDFSGIRDRVTA